MNQFPNSHKTIEFPFICFFFFFINAWLHLHTVQRLLGQSPSLTYLQCILTENNLDHKFKHPICFVLLLRQGLIMLLSLPWNSLCNLAWCQILHVSAMMVALIFAISPEMKYFLEFTIFSGSGNSNGFHFTFPTTIALTSQVRKPIWVCTYIYPNYMRWDWRNNRSMCSWTHWTYCESSFKQISINQLTSLRFYFN